MTKANVTITSKTTKEGLVDYLKTVVAKVTERNLRDRVTYTIAKATEATKKDLMDLAKEVQSFMAPTQLNLVEGALKPKNITKQDTPKTDESEEAAKEILKVIDGNKNDAPAKDTGKKTIGGKNKKNDAPKEEDKKPEPPKDDKPKTDKSSGKKDEVAPQTMVVVASFPKEVDTELGHLKLNHDIKDIQAYHKAIEEGKELLVAFYWNKRMLAQFEYDVNGVVAKQPKSFPHDLDLCNPIYVSDNFRVAYMLSAYTEVMFCVRPKDFEIVEDQRFCDGMSWDIYEITK
jgi:hypothetical protein